MFAGFQIAMHDALLVCRFERIGDLRGDGDGFVDGQRSTGDASGEGRPVDELHHQRVAAGDLLEAVNDGDVRMIDGCASRSKRAARSASPLTAAGSTLIATSRCRRWSRARCTSPIPPEPIAPETS
jgi:hypothetical protein